MYTKQKIGAFLVSASLLFAIILGQTSLATNTPNSTTESTVTSGMNDHEANQASVAAIVSESQTSKQTATQETSKTTSNEFKVDLPEKGGNLAFPTILLIIFIVGGIIIWRKLRKYFRD